MKMLFLTLFHAIMLSFSFHGEEELLNKKLPPLTGKTLSGTTIDPSFFEKKVTLINFMYIGYPPCMKEVKILSNLHQDYLTKNFQILCIAPHTARQLMLFNGVNPSIYSKVRDALGVKPIPYHILPECLEEDPKKHRRSLANTVSPECNLISKKFGVEGYPMSFLVDQKGVIRKIYEGFAIDEPDSVTLQEFHRDIDHLLNQ